MCSQRDVAVGAGQPTVRRVTAATGGVDLRAAYALRRRVFVDEQGVPPAVEYDAADPSALHVVAAIDGVVVGTGRLVLPRTDRATPAPRIGRMAVDPTERGHGVGTALLRALEHAAADAGASLVTLHAQCHARRFYDRAGYRQVGEPFTEAGIEHVEMRKSLPVVRAVTDADGPALAEVIDSCFAEYPGCVLSIDTEETWLRAPATAYGERHGRMWVAELDHRVVGCIGMKPAQAAGSRSRICELKNLYVAAPARRIGLGTRLVELVHADARAEGDALVLLWSDTRFTDAHRLYERLGYARTGGERELHDLSHTVEWEFRFDLAAPPHLEV